ncbi:GIY-YIG nuclease family protein [Paraburkholderia sp. UCT31]|uniref:GIY-YIG nuclease family protein n=1 Tax=Paraburkholderia sp. UCT31 TaxID=2615209 RepID=UPI001655F46D|nr:GIY-YIG nuclease family protein [Paraburkholderia sp. UCT31]MBC8742616.1 GIY-YIG nuclease family protein [Paraburkholderia sp. UCT31]
MFYLNLDVPSHLGGPNPNWTGWLYLAYDYRHLDQTKIGITTRPIFKRIRESTTNPYYALFAAFHVPNLSDLTRIENYLHRKFHIGFVDHLSSGVESEWCTASPPDVLSILVEIIPNVLSIDWDEEEYDFTRTIYLPEVNPYEALLHREHLDEYIRFAAPAMYLEELHCKYRRWDARPNFLAELAAMGPRTPLTITGPQLLLDRVNYDIARRRPF